MAHRLSPEAEGDLDGIWYYIATESGSADIADRFIRSLLSRFTLLAANPHIGRRRDEDLRLNLRSFPVGDYIIFYRIEDQGILILHIIHASRDIDSLFRK